MNDLDFVDLIDVTTGQQKRLDLSHLKNMSFAIKDFRCEHGHIADVEIDVRPTNHVYSRSLTDGELIESLEDHGLLLRRFKHKPGDPYTLERISGKPQLLELRVFCCDKYASSLLLPDFFKYLSQNVGIKSMLANSGDKRTGLTLMVEPENRPSDVLLIFFRLSKVNRGKLIMMIETAYFESKEHYRAKKLLEGKDGLKPFKVLVKNVVAGRMPFDSGALNKGKKRKR